MEELTGWKTEGSGGQDLVEGFGRLCYQSWHKPNPKTSTNATYIEHILDVGHFSVIEHGYVSFYVEGVSRSLTHELIRHRHLNVSQLSQRFVDESKRDWEPVIPPLFEDDPEAIARIEANKARNLEDYDWLVQRAVENKKAKRKVAREAGRAALPNSTETKIGITGNFQTWRHFLKMRGAEAADREIRALAVEIASQLITKTGVKNVFQDVNIVKFEDGTNGVQVGNGEDKQ
jgi:thymidylate synthase (FAD)